MPSTIGIDPWLPSSLDSCWERSRSSLSSGCSVMESIRIRKRNSNRYQWLVGVVIVLTLFHSSEAELNFYEWQNTTNTGVYDVWAATNESNVASNGNFGMIYGEGGKLWLVSRRPSEWNATLYVATHGGVVSTFDTIKNSWTHKPYASPREGSTTSRDALFSLRGRLFMMTYAIYRDRVFYDQLYSWDDNEDRWTQVTLRFDKWARRSYNNTDQLLKVTVPDQNGEKAYFATSAYSDESASYVVITELSVQFDNSTTEEPIMAMMRYVYSQRYNKFKHAYALVSTPVQNGTLYTFGYYFTSPAYVRLDVGINLDNVSNTQNIFNRTKPISPVIELEEERIFQTGPYALIIGPPRSDTDAPTSRYIWAVDMEWRQWFYESVPFPQIERPAFAFDQKRRVLYAAGEKEGIYSARIGLVGL